MRTDPTQFDFDAVLDRLAATPVDMDAPCTCRSHAPHLHPPRTPRAGDWRRKFRTADWSGCTALRMLGLTMIDALTPEHLAAKPLGPGEGDPEGCTDNRGNVWVDHDAQFPVGVIAHELAHNVLKHLDSRWQWALRASAATTLLDKGIFDPKIADAMTQALCESEAETTALLVSAALGFPDGEAALMAHSARYVAQNMPLAYVKRDRVKDAARCILEAGAVGELRKAA